MIVIEARKDHGNESLISNVIMLVTCCDKNLCTKERLSRHRRWKKIPTGPSIISSLCQILVSLDSLLGYLRKNSPCMQHREF